MQRNKYRAILYCAAAVCLGGLVYMNALGNPFVYDDHIHVVGNAALRGPGGLMGLMVSDRFRPLVNLTYAIDHRFWGLNPLGYHLTSLAIHCVNVGLLFFLAVALLGDAGRGRTPRHGVDLFSPGRRRILAAFAVSATFAVHPLFTEGVGYISGRAEILCATFFLLGFICLRRAMRTAAAAGANGRLWLFLGLGAVLLGVGAKEHGAMLPLVLLIYDRLILSRSEDDPAAARSRLRRLHLPLVGLVLLAAVGRAVVLLWFEYDDLPRPVAQNLLMQFSVIWRYFFLLVLPVGQSVVHQVRPVTSVADPVALASGAALAAVLILTLALRRQAPLAALGVLWFFLLLAPSSSLIPLLEPMAEHRVYLASAGLLIALGLGYEQLLSRLDHSSPGLALLPRVGLLILVAVLTTATVARNRVWATPIALWADAAAKAPGVWAPHYALGDAHKKQGRCDLAVNAYRAAIKVLPGEPRAHLNLGICLAFLRDDKGAERVFRTVLSLDAENIRARNNLGQLALRKKAWEEAEEHFKQVLQKDPRNVKAMASLGVAAKMNKDRDAASRFLKSALELDPTNTFAMLHLAHLYETAFAAPDRALRLYQAVVKLDPKTPGAAEGVHRCRQRLRLPP